MQLTVWRTHDNFVAVYRGDEKKLDFFNFGYFSDDRQLADEFAQTFLNFLGWLFRDESVKDHTINALFDNRLIGTVRVTDPPVQTGSPNTVCDLH